MPVARMTTDWAKRFGAGVDRRVFRCHLNGVLGQAAGAYLGVPELAFDASERMFDFCTQPGFALLPAVLVTSLSRARATQPVDSQGRPSPMRRWLALGICPAMRERVERWNHAFATSLWMLGKHGLICKERFWLNLWLPSRINQWLPIYTIG